MAQRYVRIFRFVVNFRLWHPALSVEAISTEFGPVQAERRLCTWQRDQEGYAPVNLLDFQKLYR